MKRTTKQNKNNQTMNMILDEFGDKRVKVRVLGTRNNAYRHIHEVDRYGDSYEKFYRVRIGSNADYGDLFEILTYLFKQSCYCSHDCCGHIQSYVWMHKLKRVSKKEWVVSVGYFRNV